MKLFIPQGSAQLSFPYQSLLLFFQNPGDSRCQFLDLRQVVLFPFPVTTCNAKHSTESVLALLLSPKSKCKETVKIQDLIGRSCLKSFI